MKTLFKFFLPAVAALALAVTAQAQSRTAYPRQSWIAVKLTFSHTPAGPTLQGLQGAALQPPLVYNENGKVIYYYLLAPNLNTANPALWGALRDGGTILMYRWVYIAPRRLS